jgi:hypothetical protein
MKLVYVCSPLRGEPPYTTRKRNENLRLASKYSAEVAKQGFIPITPHLYFNSFLDDEDPELRKRGMAMGTELLRKCDELWVFGTTISEGMKAEIELAAELDINISFRTEPGTAKGD